MFCNVAFYLVFAYIFAAAYKQFGWTMGETQTYTVIIAGVASPLVNFIIFMFWAPKMWGEAALVGIISLFGTYAYMAFTLVVFSIVFRLMEGLPGV